MSWTDQQLDIFKSGQPDEEAIKLLQSYESFATRIDPRGYCVCTSEGKDSRVLGHLMRRAGVRHFYIHNITGIDPPELIYFQRRNFSEYMAAGYECHDIMYNMSMWQLMRKKRMPPLRQKRYCCEHLKERRTSEQGFAMISTGVRRAESSRRAKQRSALEQGRGAGKAHLNPYDQEGNEEIFQSCFDNPNWGREGLWTINPIADWPDHWIWDYSAEARLKQSELYAEGFDRLGCIGCPMAGECGRKQEFERWPGFKKLWIRAFDECIKGRKEAGLVILDHAQTAEEWFEWWISDKAMDAPIDEDQMTLEDTP